MDMREVKDLIREVLQSDISEFELEHNGTRVKLKRGFAKESPGASLLSVQTPAAGISNPRAAEFEPVAKGAGRLQDEEDTTLHFITSPIVGTVYLSPSPSAGPYVKPGDSIHEGSILCIIEAMKLMNEIPSDVEGEIVRICVENGNPVEFGQKLFAIRPSKKG
jgi:acetyl-CoA carboxylase biotin carboxyl carrier protein